MKASPTLLLCVLVALCLVEKLQASSVRVSTDDEEDVDLREEARLPGLCWLCKWGLNKVKKHLSKNSTAAAITDKLNKMCDTAGFLKSLCKKFVSSKVGVLVEELSTSDNVRTICVNVKACKKKEAFDEPENDFQTEWDEYI